MGNLCDGLFLYLFFQGMNLLYLCVDSLFLSLCVGLLLRVGHSVLHKDDLHVVDRSGIFQQLHLYPKQFDVDPSLYLADQTELKTGFCEFDFDVAPLAA